MTDILNVLIKGDPLKCSNTDLIAQTALTAVGAKIPEGWRVLSGNNLVSYIGRVAYRFEIEDENSD